MAAAHPIVQVEIRVRSLERAVAFYGQLFDWRIEVLAANSYAVADTGKMPIVGIQQTANSDVPIGVVPYTSSQNAAADAAIARGEGARVLMPVCEEASGSWSHIADPWGNELAFWESKRPTPKLQGSGVNRVSWWEVPVPDLPAAVRFYRRVCGWDFQVLPEQEAFAFHQHSKADVGIGLVGGTRAAQLGQPHIYIEVADVGAMAGPVKAAGGTISEQVGSAAEGRAFRVMRDPDGNPFGLVEPGR